jgi:Fur family transcriptional regulator, ferric uptake regulator
MMSKAHHPGLGAEDMLRSAGLYSTRARAAILEVLIAAGRPLDKKEIVGRLGRGGPDEVTVYRTLESFCRRSLVHKVFVSERAWRFQVAHNCTELQCHPHFTCRECGVTQCLTKVSIPLAKGLEKGYRLLRQQVRLEGICPACSGRR